MSLGGKGRAIDNVMVERLWRSVKYEEVDLQSYANGADCDDGVQAYFRDYTRDRAHQGLAHQTPWQAFQSAL